MLLGMYRSSVVRAIEIICFNEGRLDSSGVHENLKKLVDTCLYIMSASPHADESVLDVTELDDWQRDVLVRYQHVLAELLNVDKAITKIAEDEIEGDELPL
jgi:hypothetical protein